MKTILYIFLAIFGLSEYAAADPSTNAPPATAPPANSLLLNGDFEASGIWHLNARDSNNLVEIVKDAQSPFSTGTQGLHIQVEPNSMLSPLVTQDLTEQTDSPIQLSFDFKVNSQTAYTGGDGVLTMVMYMGATPAGTEQLRYSLMFTGDGKMMLLGKTPVQAGNYNAGVWYHVSATFPGSAGGDAHITLTSFGGSPATTTGTIVPFNAAPTKYRLLRIQPGFGTHGSLEDVYVDNVTIQESPSPTQPKAPVPGP